MAELEEPILSTLGRPNDLAGTFMNAFYAASQISAKKQPLENQLQHMQQQMTLGEQKHELDMEKADWQMKYQSANLARQYDAMQQREYLQKKGFDFKSQQDEIKAARKDAV